MFDMIPVFDAVVFFVAIALGLGVFVFASWSMGTLPTWKQK